MICTLFLICPTNSWPMGVRMLSVYQGLQGALSEAQRPEKLHMFKLSMSICATPLINNLIINLILKNVSC